MNQLQVWPQGGITSPQGFSAGAVAAGLKVKGGLDLALIYSEVPCRAAGLFTTNKIKAAPVIVSRRHLRKGKAQAVVVNSGCANACTGERGITDAEEMAAWAAGKLGIPPEMVLVSSTGVIGTFLPLERIREGIASIALSPEGGHSFVSAIMTTDTLPKEIAVRGRLVNTPFTIGGAAKGAGMLHPQLATMLCFVTTDAAVDSAFLKKSLCRAADLSFNMITVDGDTSPSDTLLILANGLAGNKPLSEGMPGAEVFQQALEEVCLFLAKSVARDGEGATRLIEIRVEGAVSDLQARRAARTIAGSPLVKAAVYGADPNWGRIIAALGRSGARLEESKIDLYLDNLCLMEKGSPLPFNKEEAQNIMSCREVPIRVNLNLGPGMATAWGCDLSPRYAVINSEYTT